MSIVQKIKNFWLGSEEQYEDGFDDLFRIDGGKVEHSNASVPPISDKKKLKESQSAPTSHLRVIDKASPFSATNEVVVLEPVSFSQAPDIIGYLRKGSSVVLNLCKIDPEQSQRLVDFVCGGIYALDGSQRRVGEGVFLLVPSSMNISSANPSKDGRLALWVNKENETQSESA
ncbi:MAG: cell division protein SepF [Candidatus Caenarcaniphilales bacterium]|nr:cell division protein SepF [Candidatus Caenarcaniphilales bacterium]